MPKCVSATHMQEAPSARINMLFMLDAFLADDFQNNSDVAVYRALAVRDLKALVDMVVPANSWDAVINAGSTRQVRNLLDSDARY